MQTKPPLCAVCTGQLDTKPARCPVGCSCSRLSVCQVLVYHDLLGMLQHPHHAKVTPKFCKQYAQVGHVIQEALGSYRAEVSSGAFPSAQHTPYKLLKGEAAGLAASLEAAGFRQAAQAVQAQQAQAAAAAAAAAAAV